MMKIHNFRPLPSGLLFPVLLCFLYAAGCSSAPKRPTEIYDLRSMAETQLELGNNEADRGNYVSALDLVSEAERIAISADDPSLRIRAGLSRGNVLFSLGRIEDAAEIWAMELDEAERENERELAAVCRIHIARGKLLTAIARGAAAMPDTETAAPDSGTGAGGTPEITVARSVSAAVSREMDRVRDRLYTALGWTVIAMAEKESARYNEAESAAKKALAIHVRDRYLEQAAYDWFLIASIRSMAGQFAAAEAAIEEAIGLDRRAENSWGLAADWRAQGSIRKKSGNAAGAETAFQRSAEIYRALGLESAAAAVERLAAE
jgi:tetratricopeptide (TPR) repeat protein